MNRLNTILELNGIEINGRTYNFDIEFSYHWDNDGIGSYEYWGMKGYDKGHDYVEIDSIDSVTAYCDEDEVEVPEGFDPWDYEGEMKDFAESLKD